MEKEESETSRALIQYGLGCAIDVFFGMVCSEPEGDGEKRNQG